MSNNHIEYGYNKTLGDYSITDGANSFLKNEINTVIDKIVIDAKTIAKTDNDNVLLRSHIQKSIKNVLIVKKSRLTIITGILGGILISITFTFVPQIIDDNITNQSIMYILLSTLVGGVLLTYSILKR